MPLPSSGAGSEQVLSAAWGQEGRTYLAGPAPPARPLCPHSPEVAGVLWARTDLGGPESPLCSCPTGPAAMHLVSAPGPWAAGGLPGPARRGGRRRGGRPTLTTGKQTLCFCGGRSGARAAPHSQRGVNSLPNGSRETSPKRAGPGWGTEALTGDAGPWSTVQPPRAGCPEGHRETGLQNMGAPAAPPQQPRGSVPEGGDPFWGSERTATQSNNLILQTTRSGDET